MQKFLYSFFLIILSLIVFIIVYLSTVGLETSRFNNIIIDSIKNNEPNIQLTVDKIKIKFDLKKFQVNFSALDPKIIYHDVRLPITEITIHSKISSILKSNNEVSKVILSLQNFKTEDIKKLAIRIKPSNYKTFLLNNLNSGKIEKILIEIKLDENLKIYDYKISGSIKKIQVKIFDNLLVQDVNLNFVSDKNLTLINSISANYYGIAITNGSLSLKENKVIEAKFNTKFNLNETRINKLSERSNITFLKENKINVQGSLLHKFTLKIDKNFQLIDYDYKSTGNISDSKIILKEPLKNNFIKKKNQENINIQN